MREHSVFCLTVCLYHSGGILLASILVHENTGGFFSLQLLNPQHARGQELCWVVLWLTALHCTAVV
jgi:hypothetical protein